MSVRRARRRGSYMNREERRRAIKSVRRRIRVADKVITLLSSCSAEAIKTGFISTEEVETLRVLVRAVDAHTLNYYPVPKMLHNKIRNYVHNHPNPGPETVYDVVTEGILFPEYEIGASLSPNPHFASANSLLDLLREANIRLVQDGRLSPIEAIDFWQNI